MNTQYQTITVNTLYNPFQMERDIVYQTNLGQLHLWFKRSLDEIMLTYIHSTSGEKRPKFPENAVWTRWAVKEDQCQVAIKPAFPDRAVVIVPESSFWLTQSNQTTIFIRIPVWIQFILANKNGQQLIELPAKILSNTWFGSFADGELCFWHSSGIRRTIDRSPEKKYLAICTLQLVNNSEEDLLVDRICLRVNRLKLYSDGEYLWSDTTKIVYKGKNEEGQINMSGYPPSQDKKYTLLSAPRQHMRKSFMAKSFQSLKELPGLGF